MGVAAAGAYVNPCHRRHTDADHWHADAAMRNQADEPELNSFERLLIATVKYDMRGADAQGEFDRAGFGTD
jgi:hypothetical protein